MADLQQNVDLTQLNTFHLPCTAHYFATVKSLEDLRTLIASPVFKENEHLILGGGSNMLFATTAYRGLIIKNEIKSITLVAETNDHATLAVGSGEAWHDLVLHTINMDLGGLENLSSIPGTVGASPIQNIGAYGVEVRDTIECVEAFEFSTGEVRTFSKDECAFGYRDSYFKNEGRDQFFILNVRFKLTKAPHTLRTNYGAIGQMLVESNISTPTIRDVSDAVIAIRSSKLPDPKQIGNAGSFFKNPSIPQGKYESLKLAFPDAPSFPGENDLTKIPAAWLIEQCGFKGITRDGIGVHKNQALVLVNYGDGKGRDIWKLALEIQQAVMGKFSIEITPEVNVVKASETNIL